MGRGSRAHNVLPSPSVYHCRIYRERQSHNMRQEQDTTPGKSCDGAAGAGAEQTAPHEDVLRVYCDIK